MFLNKNFEAIVIGGSWGGTGAIIKILKNLPCKFLLPVIIVLHRQKYAVSYLQEIIQKYTTHIVKEAEEKEPILENYIYIAPPGYHLLIEKDRTFSLDASENVNYSMPSIDLLFHSASKVYKDKLIGILLTGANSDGSDGLKSIFSRKGLTIVQEPEEAESSIMPLSAIAKFKVDHIYKIDEISKFICNVNHE